MSRPTAFVTLIEDAIRAPSSHNTQPWLFRAAGNGVQLMADRRRALPVNDPDDRELTISCGCALLNLRAAAAAKGIGLTMTLAPDAAEDELLATLAATGTADGGDLAAIAPAIGSRHTHRKRFADRPLPDGLVRALVDAAEAEGAWLDPLEGEERRHAAVDLVSEGDAAQWADPHWRRELAAWMHPRRSGDGLTLPWLAVPVAQLVVRSFDMGGGVAAQDRELAEGSPLLAVLGTAGDRRADWLAAGQALERVLLTAAAAGVQASYLNQPIQVARLRPRLADLCRPQGMPQVLLRLGEPEEDLPAAPRRPLDEVLLP